MEALQEVSNALQIMQVIQLYSPRKDSDPASTFMTLSGYASTLFEHSQLPKWFRDMEQYADENQARTEVGAWRRMNEDMCEGLARQASVKLAQHLKELQRAAIGLRLIKSPSIVNPANVAAMQALQQLANNVQAMAHPRAPSRRGKVIERARQAVAGMQGRLAAVEASVQAEIEATL